MQVNVSKSVTTVKLTKREKKILTEASDILLELGHIVRQDSVSDTGRQIHVITAVCGDGVSSEDDEDASSVEQASHLPVESAGPKASPAMELAAELEWESS